MVISEVLQPVSESRSSLWTSTQHDVISKLRESGGISVRREEAVCECVTVCVLLCVSSGATPG